jgi:hypothetical protein
MKALSTLFAALLFVTLVGCDSDPNATEEAQPLNMITVTDFAVDPFVGFVNGQPVGSNRFAFYCLTENKEISPADSASTSWDIAVRGTTVLVNGGTSGPGAGAAQVVEGIFEEITMAPSTGWAVDGPNGTAIPTGSGNGWYNYDFAAQTVTPIPGRVLLVKTADGRYAKIRIVSYYKGAPETPTNESEGRYLTFDYVFQPDGSTVLQ